MRSHRLLSSLAPLALVSSGWAQETFVHWETPHVHGLEVTPGAARLLAVNTADNRLEVFDLGGASPLLVDSIPVGLDPVSVRARSATEVWVVNQTSDSVSVVDLTTGNVVDTLATEDEPADVLFAGTPERAYVSCSQTSSVLVFDPANRSAAPLRIAIKGEEPRALAVSPAGDEVYVALFESGNGTTILGGGLVEPLAPSAFPPNTVNHTSGPYGGQNPPPNDGVNFEPPFDPQLPPPPRVSLIVRRTAGGLWLDDNGGDWTPVISGPHAPVAGRPVGWTLLDHDVATIDTNTMSVSYAGDMMNICMALAVNPGTGQVTVVGTDATNEVRFEPVLNGVFLRVNLGVFDPDSPASSSVTDLNAHLDYSQATLPRSERDKSISDPRGIAWNASGTRAYVTGMGTNNVVVLDGSGARAGINATIEVGEGPTGVVLDEARDRLYVLNKFEASVSVIDTTTESEVARIGFHDPSPPSIKLGRRHLYDAHATSGTGLVSCASCHVDARMDRLSWDLGDPAGSMKSVAGQNLGANLPGPTTDFEDWHPMKGPMLTQTLQDIIGKEPFHWRGDRDGIREFNGAFESLLGDDEQLSAGEMQEFEDFLATIHYPPNPFRNFDNGLSTDVPLPGHFTTGRYAPAGQPLPNGNAVAGRALYMPPNLLDRSIRACVTCHTLPTGTGTDHQWVDGMFEPFPEGPHGENHTAVLAGPFVTNVTLKVPQLRNLYDRTGFNLTQLESTAGFGYSHDGSVDSLERFMSEPGFLLADVQELADMIAFLLSFSGTSGRRGTLTDPLDPIGAPSLGTHAAVGVQTTLLNGANPDRDKLALIDAMIVEAGQEAVGLVVKGRLAGKRRGWMYVGGGKFQSDRRSGILTRAALQALAGPGSELTFTVVPFGSEQRIGVDRDGDGAFDRDELDFGSDPADASSKPKALRVPR